MAYDREEEDHIEERLKQIVVILNSHFQNVGEPRYVSDGKDYRVRVSDAERELVVSREGLRDSDLIGEAMLRQKIVERLKGGPGPLVRVN